MVPQQAAKEAGVSRKDMAINNKELKWQPFEHRHVNKEVPAEQPDRESLKPVLGNQQALVSF